MSPNIFFPQTETLASCLRLQIVVIGTNKKQDTLGLRPPVAVSFYKWYIAALYGSDEDSR